MATGELLATGAALGPDDWDRPATDRWTVCQLVSHVVRSLAVTVEYLDADLEQVGPGLSGATGHYRTALARAAATPGDRPFVHAIGWLRFDDYLVTRVVEVVLHTLDVQLACGLAPSAPVSSLAVVRPVLVELTDRADPLALVLALTGRDSPLTCTVLG